MPNRLNRKPPTTVPINPTEVLVQRPDLSLLRVTSLRARAPTMIKTIDLPTVVCAPVIDLAP